MKHELAAILTAAGLVLAQLSTSGSSTLGVPSVPGTRVPESNPATSVMPPPNSAPSGLAAPSASAGSTPGPSSNSGPAYSFGAAPAPLVSPGR
jgi:hypothetical protein